jgi:protein ImuB
VLALELGWTMDARRNTATQGELLLRTAEPTQDITHLQRLLTEHLAQLSLAAPAQYLHLRTLETQALAGHSASLLPDEQITGDSLQQMLERLSARLGPQQVLHLQACADHRPEHMQSWQSATDAKALTAASNTSSKLTKSNLMKTSINHDNRLAAVRAEPGQSALRQAQGERCCAMKPSALYPSWLLAQPLKLSLQAQCPQYHGPLSLLAGPQRLETGWWGGGTSALRDYFVARNPQQTLLWIFRERLPPHGATNDSAAHWYLHGFFA